MRHALLRISLMTAILLGAFFVMLIEVPDSAEAAQVTAQIALDNPEQKADVGPGQSGIVTFTGMVSVAMIGPGQNVQLIEVTLQASAGWPATVSPSSIKFAATETGSAQPFTVVVRVPNFTSFTQSGEVSVTGRARTIPGALSFNIPPTDGIISINPYYQVSVICDEPYSEISPGDKFMYQLKIRNEGNSRDRIRVKIDEDAQEKMTNDGWVVSLGTPMISIEEGKEDIIPISVTGSSEWTLYQNHISTIKVIVKSETSVLQGASPESYEYTLFMRERSIFIPGFEPILVVMALAVVTIAARKVAGRRG